MAMSMQTRSLLAGLLVGNSAPHLGSAAAGRVHITPLAGRGSSPSVNGVWGLANLVAGLALLRSSARPGVPASPRRRLPLPARVRKAAPAPAAWDSRLVRFETGVALFATFMGTWEAMSHANTPRPATRKGKLVRWP